MNETFTVGTMFDCSKIEQQKHIYQYDMMWRQTLHGCKLLYVLQDMYNFNMVFKLPTMQAFTEYGRRQFFSPHLNNSIDIFAKPSGLSKETLENSYPIESIFTWRYGFMLKPPYGHVLRNFYSLPFTRPVWNTVYLMIMMVSFLFYYLSRWEKRMRGGYSSYHHELLLAFGACCQHILPLQTNICSRRIAYLSFMLFAYVLQTFYSSNLLSHLVSDKDRTVDLETLANSDYECVVLGSLNMAPGRNIYPIRQDTNLSIIERKLSKAKFTNVHDGLTAVMTSQTALLVDYYTVYPVLSKMYATEAVCQLIEIDLYSNVKKYLHTSKSFSYKEEFKVGILRMKESGILQRLLSDEIVSPLNCAQTYPMSAQIEQLFIPLCILLGTYAAAGVILIIEREYHKRSKLWPYVE